LVAVVGVNSFIATLGTSSLLMAVAELVGQGNYVGPFPTAFADLTSSNPGGVPMITIYLFVLAVGLWYVLEHSPIGRRFYATGANLDAARLAGVRTNRYVFVSFVICGLGAGAAGVLLASSLTTVDQTIGSTYLLPPYAAAFLGATQLKPGRFNVWGTIVALFLLGTGVQGLQLAGAEPWVTDLFDGVALISAVSIAVFVEKGRGRDEKRRAAART
jgi:ribose transport system permease protein